MDNEEIPISEIKICWENLSSEIKEAIFKFDAGKVAFLLLKGHKDLSTLEACGYANAIIKIYKNQMGFSEEVH